jgi:putative membrane protein
MKVPNLTSPIAKASYVAGVTTLFTFLGCWTVLARQEIGQQEKPKTAMTDEHFAKKAAQGGLAEVKMGQLAQEKGSSDAVKQFGQRMVEDHTKANRELKEAATQEHVTLPTEMDSKDQSTYDALSKLSGAAFDQAYARDMVKDHQQDVTEFSSEAANGQKEAIKNFASQTLPTLKDHLKQAKEMRQSTIKSSSQAFPRKTSKAPSGR